MSGKTWKTGNGISSVPVEPYRKWPSGVSGSLPTHVFSISTNPTTATRNTDVSVMAAICNARIMIFVLLRFPASGVHTSKGTFKQSSSTAMPHCIVLCLPWVESGVEKLVVVLNLEMRKLQPHSRRVKGVYVRGKAAIGVVDVVANVFGVGNRPRRILCALA